MNGLLASRRTKINKQARTKRTGRKNSAKLNYNHFTSKGLMHISEQDLKKILNGISVAPQPQILVDLQMAQVMGDDDPDSLYKLIRQDIGLSGTLLKLYNNHAMDTKPDSCSILQALQMMGADALYQIANGLSIKGELDDGSIAQLNAFWDCSNDTARVCELIGLELNQPDAELLYALGLFHNAGMALMFQKWPDYFETLAQAYQGEHPRIIDLENQRYQTNHSVLGYYTARAWRLPALVCEVIAEHHSTAFALSHWPNDHPGRNLLSILKVAEYLCNSHRIYSRQKQNYEWLDIQELVYLQLGIGDYEVEAWHDRFRDLGINSVDM